MTIVVDTNVVMSGIFFTGAPNKILQACMAGTMDLVVSPDILLEYRRVADELATQFPDVDASRVLDLITIKSLICDARTAPRPGVRRPRR